MLIGIFITIVSIKSRSGLHSPSRGSLSTLNERVREFSRRSGWSRAGVTRGGRPVMPRRASLSVELLDTFLRLLENGGDAARTATELGLNQPSMSKRMALLQRG